jgi:pyrroline-5-carboxylate reductase
LLKGNNIVMSKTLTFIGSGNMARSLIMGLINDETPLAIRVSDPDEKQLDAVKLNWSDIHVTTDNAVAVKDADVVVLAVKPQIIQKVCEQLQDSIQKTRPLVISIAAGVREASLNQWLGGNLPVVRCMPNTPALVQAGATGLFANTAVSEEQSSLAESILRSVGITLWFDDENDLDVVTAVSGSGPAYFFLVMESMQNAAEKLGLNAEDARLLVLQTAFGASRLALESSDSAAELRQKVTSKGGTTQAALEVLNQGGLPELFEKALTAAVQRSEELSQGD